MTLMHLVLQLHLKDMENPPDVSSFKDRDRGFFFCYFMNDPLYV